MPHKVTVIYVSSIPMQFKISVLKCYLLYVFVFWLFFIYVLMAVSRENIDFHCKVKTNQSNSVIWHDFVSKYKECILIEFSGTS